MSNHEKAVALWQSWDINTVSGLEKHLDSFRVLFAYHSGRIENEDITYNDTRELFENGRVINYTGSPRALFEQQNQKLCYDYLVGKLVAREPVSVELVREIHRILTSGTYDERRFVVNGERPGEFKRHDYVVGKSEVGTPPQGVESEFAELLTEVSNSGGYLPLKAGAYLHARFEYIHPFADGNGRVGRTLLNYWLMLNNYPPIIIYDEDKQGYYNALNEYNENENLDSLVPFLEGQLAKTWSRAIEASEGQKRERRGLSEMM